MGVIDPRNLELSISIKVDNRLLSICADLLLDLILGFHCSSSQPYYLRSATFDARASTATPSCKQEAASRPLLHRSRKKASSRDKILLFSMTNTQYYLSCSCMLAKCIFKRDQFMHKQDARTGEFLCHRSKPCNLKTEQAGSDRVWPDLDPFVNVVAGENQTLKGGPRDVL